MPDTDEIRPTDRPSRSVRVALVSMALLGACCFGLGWAGPDSSWIAASVNETGRPPFSDSAASILMTNLGTALLLFSGVATLGLSSVVGVGLVAAFIGASMRAVMANLGPWTTLGHSGPYMFIEFAGVALAGTAGVLPVIAGLRAAFSDAEQAPGFIRTYGAAIPQAMQVFALAVVLIVVAAAIESFS